MPRAFAEQALRPEDQDQHEHAVADHVLQLVGRGQAEAFQQQRRPHRLGKPEHQAAEHGAGKVADAAEDRRRKALDAEEEAHEHGDLLEDERVEHPRDTGHRPADGEGEDDGAPDVDADEGGGVAVFGDRAHRLAERGVAHQRQQAGEHDHRRAEGDHLRDRDRHAEDRDRALHPAEARIGAVAGAEQAARAVLQDEGQADRADQRRQRAHMQERPVGDLLDRHRHRRPARHAGGQHQRQGDQRRVGGEARVVERARREQAGEGSDHHHVAMGEVDHAQDAVDHRVAERDQRVDAADGQAEDREGHEIGGRVGAGGKAAGKSPDHQRRHRDADGQHQMVDPDRPAAPVREPAAGGGGDGDRVHG
ncbi:hypothetical protein A6302_04416 [Methylobrevis pamukkalensis]|uniref:Uncharacterized protein n=1 Tax=Methylobrevis pamukkalensis TaxID=1439726 RepID=A0A1E3GTV4_9HYPH|nr:hypothetical protein A6302_04416 [Methylobrevis pamukkalensis]